MTQTQRHEEQQSSHYQTRTASTTTITVTGTTTTTTTYHDRHSKGSTKTTASTVVGATQLRWPPHLGRVSALLALPTSWALLQWKVSHVLTALGRVVLLSIPVLVPRKCDLAHFGNLSGAVCPAKRIKAPDFRNPCGTLPEHLGFPLLVPSAVQFRSFAVLFACFGTIFASVRSLLDLKAYQEK